MESQKFTLGSQLLGWNSDVDGLEKSLKVPTAPYMSYEVSERANDPASRSTFVVCSSYSREEGPIFQLTSATFAQFEYKLSLHSINKI